MENGSTGFRTYHDDTYNGSTGSPTTDDSFLAGGTGKLTDGVLGTNSIFDNNTADWLGWNNIQPTITFDLGHAYALTGVRFFTANNSSLFSDVDVFGSADVSFSSDGSGFFGAFTWNTTAADRTGDDSRWVEIPVSQNVQFVRVHLNDGTKIGGTNPGAKPWIFISEAQVLGDPTPEPGTLVLLLSGGVLTLTARRVWAVSSRKR